MTDPTENCDIPHPILPLSGKVERRAGGAPYLKVNGKDISGAFKDLIKSRYRD